jgi:hypothetical protein
MVYGSAGREVDKRRGGWWERSCVPVAFVCQTPTVSLAEMVESPPPDEWEVEGAGSLEQATPAASGRSRASRVFITSPGRV